MKVYWVKGWPNNGLGKLLCKIPFINVFIVRDVSGKVIFCNRIIDLKKAVCDKKKSLDNLGDPMKLSDDMSRIYWQNYYEVELGEEYLSQP